MCGEGLQEKENKNVKVSREKVRGQRDREGRQGMVAKQAVYSAVGKVGRLAPALPPGAAQECSCLLLTRRSAVL